MPWPVVELVRSRMGFPEAPAAWSRAVIFREWSGSTRGSLAPVMNRTAG